MNLERNVSIENLIQRICEKYALSKIFSVEVDGFYVLQTNDLRPDAKIKLVPRFFPESTEQLELLTLNTLFSIVYYCYLQYLSVWGYTEFQILKISQKLLQLNEILPNQRQFTQLFPQRAQTLPARMKTEIEHIWQFYTPKLKEDKKSFLISLIRDFLHSEYSNTFFYSVKDLDLNWDSNVGLAIDGILLTDAEIGLGYLYLNFSQITDFTQSNRVLTIKNHACTNFITSQESTDESSNPLQITSRPVIKLLFASSQQASDFFQCARIFSANSVQKTRFLRQQSISTQDLLYNFYLNQLIYQSGKPSRQMLQKLSMNLLQLYFNHNQSLLTYFCSKDEEMTSQSVKAICCSLIQISFQAVPGIGTPYSPFLQQKALQQDFQLQEFRLVNSKLCDQLWVKHVVQMLEVHSHLTKFEVSQNFMGDKGVLQIMQKLVKMRHLEEVTFNDVGLTDQGVEMGVYLLKKNKIQLKSLGLGWSQVKQQGGLALAQYCQYCSELELNLSGVNFYIMQLFTNTKLKTVILYDCEKDVIEIGMNIAEKVMI
uniref:Uncharacterized protein n=1 Tax=Trepomonas sp. PC1 TaxID=1076344 RepID=A0A146KI37_9EUKA|eukprot:JAP95798.1 Hypothetical protein TPC1_11080 [Trepomonas sp. PC1]